MAPLRRINPFAGVEFADVAEGAAIARDLEDFLVGARFNGVSERFGSTRHQVTSMYQFRDADLPQALLDQEQRSSDGSTRLGRRGPPPACVGRLLASVHAALPELKRHYRVGWVQINDSAAADGICGHVDRPGWGDVICTFTTAPCTLTLKPDGQIRKQAPKCCATFEIPRHSLYVLSGAARHFATHAVDFSAPRVSVVLRFYLRDLLSLGAEPRPPPRTLFVGEIVTARWPREPGSTAVHPQYRSVYPAQVESVDDDEAVLTFLESADGPATTEAVPLALICFRSTRWYRDCDAILGWRYVPPTGDAAPVSAVVASDGESDGADDDESEGDDDLEPAPKGKSSRYVGVSSTSSCTGRWRAQIYASKGAKSKYIGTFTAEEEAARAYDEHARPLGKRCNFPPATTDLAQSDGSQKRRRRA